VLSYLKEARRPVPFRGEGQGRLFDRFTLVDFLLHSIKKDIPLFIYAKGFSVCSVLMPAGRLTGSYTAELLRWDIEECRGGGYAVSFAGGAPVTMAVAPPLEVATELMSYGEHIAHERVLKLGDAVSRYIELSQDFALRHDLHNVSGRGVYCKVMSSGYVEDVVHVTSRKELRLLTVARDVLCTHMYETETVLVRLLDIRVPEYLIDDMPEGKADIIVEPPGQGLCLRMTRRAGGEVWVRGFHLMRTPACQSPAEASPVPAGYIKKED